MLALARALGEAAKRLGQPSLLGEMLAGVLLGPSVLGHLSPDFAAFLVPSEGGAAWFTNGFSSLAAVLFMLVAGMDVDLSSACRQGRSVVIVSALGIAVPFGLGFICVWALPSWFGKAPDADTLIYALFFATALSISALPVIAKTLIDLGMYRSDFGMLIVAAAVVDDLVGWIVFAMVLGMMGAQHVSGFSVPVTIALTLAFAGGMLTAGRWLIHRVLRWTQAHTTWPAGVLSLSVSLALFGAAFTEWIGIHAVFGSFMAGVALGDSTHLRKRSRETLDQFISFIFAPLFFASIGLRVDFAENFDPALTAMVVALGCFTKVIGCGAGARLCGMSLRESAAVGFGMNARGAMQIILGLLALQYGVIGDRMFVTIVIMALVTTVMAGPAIQLLLQRRKRRPMTDYLSADTFIEALGGHTRHEVVRELAEAVARSAKLDPASVEGAAWEREKLMPAGIGMGVAVPQGRVAGLDAPLIGVGLSRSGVDFDAPDGQPADLIFLVVTPEDDDGTQPAILADISKLAGDPEIRESIHSGPGFGEFRGLLRSHGY